MAIKLDSDIPNEYDLIIRKDYNSEKNYSWFFFSIESDRETDIKFNILNFIKKTILFDEQNKIRILVYNKNDKWTRNTYNIQYYQNNINVFPPGEEQFKIINDEDNNFVELVEIGRYLCAYLRDKAIAPLEDGRIFFTEEKEGEEYYQMIA
jgi:hypothetical protein